MNERVKLVMQILKTKARSLGFNAAELKGVAEKMANNLTAADDADEDEIKSEIETAVDAALPFLELAQKNANRVIEENRKKNKSTKSAKEEDEENRKKNKSTKSAKEEDEEDEEDGSDDGTPAWAKAFTKKMEVMEQRLNGLAESGRASSRKQQLEAIVKSAGSFGNRILKDFDKRKFESDDEWEEYLDDIKADVEDYTTEMEQAGLKGMVHKGGGSNKGGNNKDLSGADIDEIAGTF